VWVVDVGPGSFTGVRIGVAAARALAQGFKKPLMGISGLEAMAFKKRKTPGLLAAVRPALTAEVYGAVYIGKKETLTPVLSPRWTSAADFEAQVGALSRQKNSRWSV
jgi:tRNA threonylcarbamoyladenosine biosynthesis protein TsaB